MRGRATLTTSRCATSTAPWRCWIATPAPNRPKFGTCAGVCLVVREYTLGLQGKREQQRIALDAMESVADALDDDRRRALAARRRSLLGMRTSDYAMQESAARRAMVLADRADDVGRVSKLSDCWPTRWVSKGQFAAGEALAKRGLAEARALGMRRVEGVFLNALSLIAGMQDDQVTGLAMDLQDLPIWRELGDSHGEAVALSNVGADWLWFGELGPRPALPGRRVEAESRHRRDGAGMRSARQSVAVVVAPGRRGKAVTLARAGLEIAVATQAADYEVQMLLRLGEAELALGHHEAAAEAFQRAETVARATDVGGHHDAMAGLARVALAREDMATALELVERLLVARTSPEGIEGAYARLVLFTCQRVLAHAGDSRAVELLESVHAELQARAATITDAALRRSFLDNVPLHREIVAAWTAHQSARAAAP